jgi:hypothetical protein
MQVSTEHGDSTTYCGSELKYSYKTTLVLLDLNFGKDRIYGVEIYALRTEELEIYAQGS